jgi:hypothetical protein
MMLAASTGIWLGLALAAVALSAIFWVLGLTKDRTDRKAHRERWRSTKGRRS